MYRIDFEYHNKNIGMTVKDAFEIVDNDFNNFLVWLEDNDIKDYKITNIEIYN